MEHDISDMMHLSSESPQRLNRPDEWGTKETGHCPALLLPKVMEGQPVASLSDSWLFCFPAEILDIIMNLMPMAKLPFRHSLLPTATADSSPGHVSSPRLPPTTVRRLISLPRLSYTRELPDPALTIIIRLLSSVPVSDESR
jgi:hypothetical protein